MKMENPVKSNTTPERRGNQIKDRVGINNLDSMKCCVFMDNWCKIYGSMKLTSFIKISGFILVIIGTIGLLLNEFVWESSSVRTIIFAVVNFVGLVNLAFSHFGMKDSA